MNLISTLQTNLRKYTFSKRGAVSVYIVLTLTFLLPMFIFLTVEFPHLTNTHRRLKNSIDNAASSAILCLDESQLSLGNIIVSESCANTVIKKILAHNYGLDETTLKPLPHSQVSEVPRVVVRVINNPTGTVRVRMPDESLSDAEKFDDIYVDETSVVVYVEMKMKPLFFKSFHPTIKQIGSAQSSFGN